MQYDELMEKKALSPKDLVDLFKDINESLIAGKKAFRTIAAPKQGGTLICLTGTSHSSSVALKAAMAEADALSKVHNNCKVSYTVEQFVTGPKLERLLCSAKYEGIIFVGQSGGKVEDLFHSDDDTKDIQSAIVKNGTDLKLVILNGSSSSALLPGIGRRWLSDNATLPIPSLIGWNEEVDDEVSGNLFFGLRQILC